MSNSRDLAEQAFSLLQNALKDSEQRVAELDAELKRKRRPRNKAETQAQVLEHKLDSIAAERDASRREVEQLQTIVENERVKLRQLKKRLKLAESGPDKVDKKEVNYWRSQAEEFDAQTRQYKQRINELRRELRSRNEVVDAETLEHLKARAAEADELAAAGARAQAAAAELEELRAKVANAEEARQQAETRLGERESKITELMARIAELTAEVADLGQREANTGAELTELRNLAAGHEAEATALRSRVGELEVEAQTAEARAQQQETRASELESRIREQEAELAALHVRASELEARNNELRSELADKDSELDTRTGRLNALESQLADLDRAIAERDQRITAMADTQRALEEELREEKECTVNLSEIANERREQINELSEKLDEAVERYEEAKWQLERASRFERLVKRRRKLIDSLIEALRGKQKSNTALKAGLDGLRKFKANSEQQHQKLLLRVEQLTQELKEADERLAKRKGSHEADEKLRRAGEVIHNLEERLEAQVELIENLESELSAAKAARKTAENQTAESNELRRKIEARNVTIAKLEEDVDELQMQVDVLKSELMQQQSPADGSESTGPSASASEIRKRESQIADLKRANRELEKEVARLNEAVAGWQKKYEFLSTEAPSAYQSAAGEK